ncbi:MAG: PilZ domain-containing protein [Candidatus Saccharicenans sp.]|nr:MAG: PilZ domain-containing protein [Candidatus Aminicenantes bacterium]HEK85941.1 PilZ domain-containing protein [Candidatus Aminicenantes bacterium]
MKNEKRNGLNREKYQEKKEAKIFEMPLSLKVSGTNLEGREFEEASTLSYISSEEASFLLETDVEPSSLLKLIIPLPDSLAEGQPLSLVLKGKVISMEPIMNKKNTKKVRIRLDSRYFIGREEV